MAVVAFSPDGAGVLAALDETVREWETASGTPVRIIPFPAASAVAMSPGGTRALSCCSAEGLVLTDLETSGPSITLKIADGDGRSFALSPDGTRAISSAADGSLTVWELATGNALQTVNRGVLLALASVAISADGRQMFTGSDNRRIAVWDLADRLR